MDVFVLIGGMQYESEFVLGVYHTEADAEFAREEYDRVNDDPYDYYLVQHRVVGASAKEIF